MRSPPTSRRSIWIRTTWTPSARWPRPCLNNNQLDDAEHAYQEIAAADPQDAQALVRIAECQRRQGHYEQALATLKKAQALSTDSDEIQLQRGADLRLARADTRKSTPVAARPGVAFGQAGQPLHRQREEQPLHLSRPPGECGSRAEPHRSAVAAYRQMVAAGRRVRGARLSGRSGRLSRCQGNTTRRQTLRATPRRRCQGTNRSS